MVPRFLVLAAVAAIISGCFGDKDYAFEESGGGQAGNAASPPLGGGGVADGSGGSPAVAVCAPAEQQDCYSGDASTKYVGACKPGTRLCSTDGSGWGTCAGEVLPTDESCAAPGDENCDGTIDENCGCEAGSTRSCYPADPATVSHPPCHAGQQICNASGLGWGECKGAVTPSEETCATTFDDDCDGFVNENGPECVCPPNATTECYDGPESLVGVGLCKRGLHTCNAQGTAWSTCDGQVKPLPADDCATDSDDNCDGTVNENCTANCLPNGSEYVLGTLHEPCCSALAHVLPGNESAWCCNKSLLEECSDGDTCCDPTNACEAGRCCVASNQPGGYPEECCSGQTFFSGGYSYCE